MKMLLIKADFSNASDLIVCRWSKVVGSKSNHDDALYTTTFFSLFLKMAEDEHVPSELYYLGKFSVNAALPCCWHVPIDPDFPPRSLKTYQLKTILASHAIPVPSKAKKADLIKLFQENVEPRRDAIIAEYKEQQEQKERQQKEDEEHLGRGRRNWVPSRRAKEAMEVEERKTKRPVKHNDEEEETKAPLRVSKGDHGPRGWIHSYMYAY